jgi:hypothetical protein
MANADASGTAAVALGTGSGGAGDGGFETPIPFLAGTTPADVVLADFDEDGAPDLAIGNTASSDNLSVLLSTCVPTSGTNVTVVVPNGGESWPVSLQRTIEWTKGSGVVAVNIEVSRDGGAIWETIATDQTGTSFTWTVSNPMTDPGEALVRIYDPTVLSRSDVSDAGFEIAQDPRVDVPFVPGALDLALAVSNPSRQGLNVRFTLPGAEPATLRVMDVAGRRVVSRPVETLGPGRHAIDLGRGLRAGVYVVELSQGGRKVATKAVVLN